MLNHPSLIERPRLCAKTMIDRVEEQFDFKPERLIGNTAYGTAPVLVWMGEEKGHRAACAGVGQLSATTTV